MRAFSKRYCSPQALPESKCIDLYCYLFLHNKYSRWGAQRAREAALAAKRQERSVARALRRRQEYVRRCRLELEERRRKVRVGCIGHPGRARASGRHGDGRDCFILYQFCHNLVCTGGNFWIVTSCYQERSAKLRV